MKHIAKILTSKFDDLLPEIQQNIEDIIQSVIHDKSKAVKKLKGRNGGLRTQKPKHDGIYAYLWRMCRFHSGIDPRMPIMADFDLATGIQDRLTKMGHTQFRATTGKFQRDAIYSTDLPKNFTKTFDRFIDVILLDLALDPFESAKRWQGLI